MSDPGPVATIWTHGFDRRRYALVLAAATAGVAVFMQADAHAWHGLAAAILLGAVSCALVWAGGPAERARRIEVAADGVAIDRWTRVRTRVAHDELDDARVVEHRGRPALLLVPRDRTAFFDAHRELRDVATPQGAAVPLGRRREAAEELRAALAGAAVGPRRDGG